jgi:hypothetical protein
MVVAFDWTDLGYRRYQSPGITDGAKCDGFYGFGLEVAH